MAKKKRTVKENAPVYISLPNSMSAEEMKHIIAEALVEADEIRKQRNDENNEDAVQKLRSFMGYKKYEGTNRYIGYICSVLNFFKTIVRLPMIPQKVIKGNLVSLSLLKALIVLVFQFVTWLFGLFALYFFWKMIHQRSIIYIFHVILFYILMGIFRMARIEIDKIEDRNYLIGLFTAIASTISIIIAVVKGG